jgi:hypothetical protein
VLAIHQARRLNQAAVRRTSGRRARAGGPDDSQSYSDDRGGGRAFLRRAGEGAGDAGSVLHGHAAAAAQRGRQRQPAGVPRSYFMIRTEAVAEITLRFCSLHIYLVLLMRKGDDEHGRSGMPLRFGCTHLASRIIVVLRIISMESARARATSRRPLDRRALEHAISKRTGVGGDNRLEHQQT